MKKHKINKPIRIVFLGGVTEIGKNMTAIECGGDIIVIDAGLSFPNSDEFPGIEYIIPDYTYIKERADMVKGVVFTHGHEDHIGATPYFFKDIKTSGYGSAFTIALIEHKLSENKVKADLNVVKSGDKVKLGCFEVEFIQITHSIAGAFALKITTPQGVIFHTGDFKVDYTPVDGRMPDLSRIAEIGKEGVDILLCDSTNIEKQGYAMSESKVGEKLDEVFSGNIGRRIIIATFASNIHRIQQIINCAYKYGRRVTFAGRSMENYVSIAERIGEIFIPRDIVVPIDKMSGVPYDKICVISTGTQGEEMSALTRMADNQYKRVKIGEKDTVIFSSSPIPGNEKPIYDVINRLSKLGAKVYYHTMSDIHASGHACREELKLIHSLIAPKYFIPVHGEYRHLMMHKDLAAKIGMNPTNVFIPDLGSVFEFDSKKGIRQGQSIEVGKILMDGNVMGMVDDIVLEERKRLSQGGIVIVHITFERVRYGTYSGKVNYTIKGMPNGEDIEKILVKDTTALVNQAEWQDSDEEKKKAELGKLIRRILLGKLEKRPMIIPIIDEIAE